MSNNGLFYCDELFEIATRLELLCCLVDVFRCSDFKSCSNVSSINQEFFDLLLEQLSLLTSRCYNDCCKIGD